MQRFELMMSVVVVASLFGFVATLILSANP